MMDDRGDNTAADYHADLRQQPASEQTAENANDDVAYQPVTTAFDHHTGKPTGDSTDDKPNNECLNVHLSPHVLARTGYGPFLLYPIPRLTTAAGGGEKSTPPTEQTFVLSSLAGFLNRPQARSDGLLCKPFTMPEDLQGDEEGQIAEDVVDALERAAMGCGDAITACNEAMQV